MADPMRLHKFLAHCGIASRRKAETLIAEGHVSVNDEIVTEMGVQVDPDTDAVAVDGQPVRPEAPVYIVLHKPRGYVTTVSDERDRKTVLDLVEGVPERVYPVGRLDRDSEGLLVLTNDGALAQFLTHPGCEVTKTYRVTVDGYIDDETLGRLRAGERVGGRKVLPRRVRGLHRNPRLSRVEIEIGEGLNREVRRLFAAVGHEARKLIRVRIGPLDLTGVPRGRARFLTAEELRKLRAGMAEAGFEDLPESPPAGRKGGRKAGGPGGGPKGGGRRGGGGRKGGGKGSRGSRSGPAAAKRSGGPPRERKKGGRSGPKPSGPGKRSGGGGARAAGKGKRGGGPKRGRKG